MSEHILLSSMGAGGPRQTSYYFERGAENDLGRSLVTSGFSATALWQLLDEANRPDEIWFLLTPKARRDAWDGIQDEAARLGVSVRPLDLDGGRAANDTNLFLSRTAEALPEGVRLTLDITQGLRHHAFLFFALALYVSEFRKNKLQGIWYSRIETENIEDPKPIIDLKPVLDLARWFQALSDFQSTGSLKSMSQLVKHGGLKKRLESLSHEFLTGLPIEAGITAAQLVELLNKGDVPLGEIPLEAQVRELLRKEVEPLAGDYSEKRKCELTPAELARQARLIDRYIENGQSNLAYGFMREWAINFVLAKEEVSEGWLDMKERRRIEGQLGCLANLHSQKADPNRAKLSPELVEIAEHWDKLGNVRNSLQHHGMRVDNVPWKAARKLSLAWKKRREWQGLPVFGGGSGRLLVCPLGNSPGVLYSALLHVQPDRCLVACSPQSEASVEEATSRAGWQGEVQKLVMQDVHRGIEEFGALIEQAKPWLFEADDIQANLTGGTTLLAVFIDRVLAHAARMYRRPRRRFILIDPRAPEEQRIAPWVKGDIHYIDRESNNVGGPE